MTKLTLIRHSVRTRNVVLSKLNYVQGQRPDPKTREYFYYIDHQGMLFLDDAKIKNFTSCFKEQKFLSFFYKQLKPNNTNRYRKEFPYLSLCGLERNYVRCDDVPIVYTHAGKNEESGQWYLYYGYAGNELKYPFYPDNICMLPETGRIYHPAIEKIGSVGLIKSSFAIEISKNFHYEGTDESNPPTHFTWDGKRYELTNALTNIIRNRITGAIRDSKIYKEK